MVTAKDIYSRGEDALIQLKKGNRREVENLGEYLSVSEIQNYLLDRQKNSISREIPYKERTSRILSERQKIMGFLRAGFFNNQLKRSLEVFVEDLKFVSKSEELSEKGRVNSVRKVKNVR